MSDGRIDHAVHGKNNVRAGVAAKVTRCAPLPQAVTVPERRDDPAR
jgi:hypothetical protein